MTNFPTFKSCRKAYEQGKKDAYEEVLKMLKSIPKNVEVYGGMPTNNKRWFNVDDFRLRLEQELKKLKEKASK